MNGDDHDVVPEADFELKIDIMPEIRAHGFQ